MNIVTDYPIPVEIVPFSTIDVPGHISCIVFFDGCNLNCTFCQNYQLLEKKDWKGIEIGEIIDKMEKNGFIDAISLSGGEAVLKPNLERFISHVKFFTKKKLGIDLYVNLDTNGLSLKPLKRVLKYVDKVTIDVKASDKNSIEVTRPSMQMGSYLGSVVDAMRAVKDGGKEVSARITYSPSWIEERDLVDIGRTLASAGLFIPISIQRFLKRNVREVAMGYVSPTNDELVKAGEVLMGTGMHVNVSFK